MMSFQPCSNRSCRKPVAIDHCDGPAGLLCVEHLLTATGVDLAFVDGVPREFKPAKAKHNPMKNARKFTLDDIED